MTAALERGEWSAARPGHTLPPGKGPVPILQEVGWAPGPILTGGKSRPHRDSIPDHDRGTTKGWVVSSMPRSHFTPPGKARYRPGTYFTGGWVGPRASLDRCGKTRPHRDSIPDRPARSQSVYRLSYLAHVFFLILSLILGSGDLMWHLNVG